MSLCIMEAPANAAESQSNMKHKIMMAMMMVTPSIKKMEKGTKSKRNERLAEKERNFCIVITGIGKRAKRTKKERKRERERKKKET